jgi:hypothetical protein
MPITRRAMAILGLAHVTNAKPKTLPIGIKRPIAPNNRRQFVRDILPDCISLSLIMLEAIFRMLQPKRSQIKIRKQRV